MSLLRILLIFFFIQGCQSTSNKLSKDLSNAFTTAFNTEKTLSDELLCWNIKNSILQKYKNEAKRRGLYCGLRKNNYSVANINKTNDRSQRMPDKKVSKQIQIENDTDVLANGAKYIGDYKNGKFHGHGRLSFPTGEIYEGQFKFGKRNGNGTNVWPNGTKYVGTFLNDKFHGKGKIFLNNGSTHSGKWKFGKKHGKGISIRGDGRKISGIWLEGRFLRTKVNNQYKDSPYMGIFIQQVTNEIAKSLGLKSTTGILVSKTNKDGPAFKYGIKPGDILLEFNGEKMKKMIDLPDFVKNSSVGETINFLIWRNGELLNINVVLENYTLTTQLRAELEQLTIKAMEEDKQKISSEMKILEPNKTKSIKQQPANQIGSGFYVSKFRHIITNQHVVNKCNKITVGDSISKQIPATLIASDKRNDLAILQTVSMEMASADTKSFIQNLSIEIVPIISGGLMRSEDVKGGEEIVVAGYPLGNMVSDTIKVTKGIVSATRGMDNNFSQFEIDAVIRKGNSGGPIYDKRGNIVGVAVSRLSINRTDTINFGIKGSTVKQFLSANDVPTTWANRVQRIDTQDLYKIASKQTVMVVCHRD